MSPRQRANMMRSVGSDVFVYSNRCNYPKLRVLASDLSQFCTCFGKPNPLTTPTRPHRPKGACQGFPHRDRAGIQRGRWPVRARLHIPHLDPCRTCSNLASREGRSGGQRDTLTESRRMDALFTGVYGQFHGQCLQLLSVFVFRTAG